MSEKGNPTNLSVSHCHTTISTVLMPKILGEVACYNQVMVNRHPRQTNLELREVSLAGGRQEVINYKEPGRLLHHECSGESRKVESP